MLLEDTLAWFSDPAQWAGPAGVPWRILEHLGYTVLATLIAAATAFPIGVYIGHTGRWRNLTVLTTCSLRALPTLGLLTLLALWLGIGLATPIIARAVLCVPPLLTGVYAGFEAADALVVDAARAQGMTEAQIVLRVKLPLALVLIVGGIRSGVLQVITTATVAAFIGAGGLGRYIIDGLAVSDTLRVLGGAIVVVLLALLIDALFAAAQRFSTYWANPAAETLKTPQPRNPDQLHPTTKETSL